MDVGGYMGFANKIVSSRLPRRCSYDDINDDTEPLSLAESHILALESVYEQTSSSGYVAYSACDSLGILNQQLERLKRVL